MKQVVRKGPSKKLIQEQRSEGKEEEMCVCLKD